MGARATTASGRAPSPEARVHILEDVITNIAVRRFHGHLGVRRPGARRRHLFALHAFDHLRIFPYAIPPRCVSLQADLYTGDHHWEVRTPPAEAMIGVEGVHAYEPYSLASIDTRTSVESREQKDQIAVPRADVVSRERRSADRAPTRDCRLTDRRRTIVPKIETRIDDDNDDYSPREASSPDTARHIEVEPKVAAFRPLAQWDSLSPMMVPNGFRKPSVCRSVKGAGAQNNTFVRTRFQRFIQRLESAGPQLVLDRMKESQQEPTDLEEELLEQQLWLLTGFQLQSLGKARIVPKPQCDTGKILELYGNLCK
jgi:hypothetical protein